MIQSGGRRLLLLFKLRMIQSGASGLISPVHALVVLWPLFLVFPRMFLSRAIHGFVSASLHFHGLVRVFASLHHRGLLLLAASLLLQGRVLLAAAPHHHGLVHLFTLLHHHRLVLTMVALPVRGLALISASLLYHGLVLTAASLHHPGLIRRSDSLLHHGPSASLLHRVSSPSSSSLHQRISSALSFALPPDLTPSLHHLLRPPVSFASGGHFPLDAPVLGLGTPFGCSAPGNSALGVVTAPSCFAPDVPIRGICPPRVPRLSSPGCGGSCCLIHPG